METTHLETLPFGPLTDRTVHLCIDMQNLFALDTPWHTPWMDRVLPVVARIAERHPARTVLTRFIPPERPDQMPGSWRRYYERWRDLTQERMDPGLIELVPPLRAIAPPAEVIDKRVYSPFFEPDLPALLRRRGTESLVITGAETDVCVLAAVLDAVDFGYRVVLATDALCSSSDETHDALLTSLSPPFWTANRDCEQQDDPCVLGLSLAGGAILERRRRRADTPLLQHTANAPEPLLMH